MARLFYGHVISNGVKIHYYRTGDEKPPVVFLHGLSDNGLCWSRLAVYLEPWYDVIMVDARGHGFSDATPAGYSLEDRAADVAGLLAALHLDKPPVVGHSMGAETAAKLAAAYPKLVGSLILEDPPFWAEHRRETAEKRAQRREAFGKQIQEWRNLPLDEIVQAGKRQSPTWSDADLFQWAKSKQQVNMLLFDHIDIDPVAWRQYAHLIKCPVLLIGGNPRLGGVITAEVVEELKKVWKKPEILQMENAGHSVRREQFEPYLDAVKKFLRKHTDW